MGLANQPCLRSCSVMSHPTTVRLRSRRTQRSDFFSRKLAFKFEKRCQLSSAVNDEPVSIVAMHSNIAFDFVELKLDGVLHDGSGVGLKSNIRLSASGSKIVFDWVARFRYWGAQAARLQISAACRDRECFAQELRIERCCRQGCRQLQAGSLCFPNTVTRAQSTNALHRA
jgi:hypothetical protein